MNLKHLLKSIETKHVEGDLDREVTGLCYDSRRVTPGKVFVAVKGSDVDGHDYICEAIDKGASAIICERNGFASHRAAKIVVENSRRVMGALAAEFYGHPSRKLRVIGVTGTNGKTTTVFVLKHLLESAGVRTGLISTVHYEAGDRILPATRTTPESIDIQQLMFQMVQAGCEACVMEVSSHAVVMDRVSHVEFDAAVFTNLTRDHLDYHQTMENYFEAKRSLFRRLETGAKNTVAVANTDDAYGARLLAESGLSRKICFGFENGADFRAADTELTEHGFSFQLKAAGSEMTARCGLLGRHNVYNALGALAAVAAIGVDIEKACGALEKTPPVPGRLESVDAGQQFNVIVDYAHTADALENVLTTLREITPGRLLLAFGCGGNRDQGKRTRMGEVAARLADMTIFTSDNPRREPPAAIAAQIEAGYRATRSDNTRTILDRHVAIREIIHAAGPGDTVLIAGKGHETYQELHDSVVPFDDRRHAAEVLHEMMIDRKILKAA